MSPKPHQGGWNYADMMEVGDVGLTADEQVTHFLLFAILASPLIAGNDLTSMSNSTRDLLTAPEVLAVNQDPLGRQGTVVAGAPTNASLLVSSDCSSPTSKFARGGGGERERE